MADIITKILIRQGTNEQRLTAGGTGVILDSGEPGFCFDTKRLFVGDGVASGGWPAGVQNLGKVTQLFDSAGNFTTEAQDLINLRGACIGDIIYDFSTKQIWYFATASLPISPSDLVAFDTSIKIDTTQFTLNQDGQLQIKQGGVFSNNLDVGVVDGITLTKPSYGQPISVREQSLENKYLATMPTNSVKANKDGYTNVPSDVELGENTVLGRRTGNIEAIPTSELLGTAILAGNGILFDSVGTKTRINIDPQYIAIDGEQITINKPISLKKVTAIEEELTVYADANVQGTLRVGQDVIAFTSSDLRLKTDLNVISDAIEKVSSLVGYEFTYNSNADSVLQGVRTYGVLAQDLKRVLPLAVNERDPSGDGVSYLGVDYDKIIPLLIEAIKELNNKLERKETLKKCCCNNK